MLLVPLVDDRLGQRGELEAGVLVQLGAGELSGRLCQELDVLHLTAVLNEGGLELAGVGGRARLDGAREEGQVGNLDKERIGVRYLQI